MSGLKMSGLALFSLILFIVPIGFLFLLQYYGIIYNISEIPTIVYYLILLVIATVPALILLALRCFKWVAVSSG